MESLFKYNLVGRILLMKNTALNLQDLFLNNARKERMVSKLKDM